MSNQMMLRDEIERTTREFIPHSASYCIPDLVKAILELLKKCIPKEKTEDNLREITWAEILSYNQALTEIKRRIKC